MRHLISAIPIYITNICGKFHLNPITYFRDIVSCKISVNARTDRQTDRDTTRKHKLLSVMKQGIIS